MICILSLVLMAAGGCLVALLTKERKMQHDGRLLKNFIDEFYKKENRLPQCFEIREYENEHGVGPFYEKTTDSTYSIYFSLGFDNYYIYDSQKDEWYFFT